MTITISNNALPAHTRHQDGRDIVPAPAEGCPAAPAPAPAAAQKAPAAKDNGHEKVTICHATGSETNPFVTITIAEPAVAAHRRHQHEEDIIPAPAEGCPAPAATTQATRTGRASRASAREVPGLAVVPAAAPPARVGRPHRRPR